MASHLTYYKAQTFSNNLQSPARSDFYLLPGTLTSLSFQLLKLTKLDFTHKTCLIISFTLSTPLLLLV